MDRDYFQEALLKFNTDKPQWFGWKTHKDNGDKIPNKDRMQYKYIKLNNDTAILPSEADVNAKIQELKDADIVPEYVKLRLTEYPPIADQLDRLWHSIDDNAELKQKYFAFYEAIKAVKAKYPK